MRLCIRSFWSMHIRQDLNRPMDRSILSEPICGNYRFANPVSFQIMKWWHNVVDVGMIGDLFHRTQHRRFTSREWRFFIREGFEEYYGKRITPAALTLRMRQIKRIYNHIQSADSRILQIACMTKGPITTELTALTDESAVTYCYSHQSHHTVAFIDAMGVPQDTGTVFVQDDSYVAEAVAY